MTEQKKPAQQLDGDQLDQVVGGATSGAEAQKAEHDAKVGQEGKRKHAQEGSKKTD